MRLVRWILFPFLIISAQSFTLFAKVDRPVATKMRGLVKLIRPENIAPTMLLNFAGGWLVNPSAALFYSKPFLASSTITLFVTFYSMIVNDLFDVRVDALNNPGRPLITGQVRRGEAAALALFFAGASEYLNMRFVPVGSRSVPRLALFMVSAYTPILKRVVLIKNLSCAGLITFSLYFTGRIVDASLINNHPLFNIAAELIFWGSLQNEILLDICDREGDRKNGVPTIPVLFGRDAAYAIANFIVHFNIIWNLFYSISREYSRAHGLLVILLCAPLLNGLRKIKNSGDLDNIKRAVNSTPTSMFLVLMYLCALRLTTK